MRDLQDNINTIRDRKCSHKNEYKNVINKEIIFPITYVREYYNIASAEIEQGLEHKEIIRDIIVNSSSCKGERGKSKTKQVSKK